MGFTNQVKSGLVKYILTDEPAFVMVGKKEDLVLSYDEGADWDNQSKS